jgi:Family of unknown function (DUF6328)
MSCSPSPATARATHRDEAAIRSVRRAHQTASSTRRDDIWNAGQRSETPLKRADRNFAELLQELRVAQTGVQILFAFLLGLAFTDRFARLGAAERDIYIATLAASALTGALLVAPVMAHRLLFQRGFKCELVRIGHGFAIAGLCGLLTAIVGGLLLVLEVFFGGSTAVVTAVALAALFASLWVGPALWVVHRHPRAHLPGQPQAVIKAAPAATSGNPPAAPRLRTAHPRRPAAGARRQAPRQRGLAARPRGACASAGRHGEEFALYQRAAIGELRDRPAERPNRAAARTPVRPISAGVARS